MIPQSALDAKPLDHSLDLMDRFGGLSIVRFIRMAIAIEPRQQGIVWRRRVQIESHHRRQAQCIRQAVVQTEFSGKWMRERMRRPKILLKFQLFATISVTIVAHRTIYLWSNSAICFMLACYNDDLFRSTCYNQCY